MGTTSCESANLEGSEMFLERDGADVTIMIGPSTLMGSYAHDSEDELGRLVAAAVRDIATPRVLIGGLGLGFTLRAALDAMLPDAQVDVAELVPDVVTWNREDCGEYAGRPLDDPRVTLYVEDVAAVMARSDGAYDVIALDVDNGPCAVTHPRNDDLYTLEGLARARAALRPGGMLAVWSSFPSDAFTEALAVVGAVELVQATAMNPDDPHFFIWLATRPPDPAPTSADES